MTVPAHSPLGMSVLERRLGCPGSMRMEEGRPDTPNKFAERGTELHAAAAECLLRGLEAADYLPDDPEGVDVIAPYLAAVRTTHAAIGGRLLVEQAVSIETLHTLLRGTADCVIIAPPILWICDLKTGQGHVVPVRHDNGRPNLQLAAYGLAAWETLARGLDIDRVELCVVQPRIHAAPQLTTLTLTEIFDLASDLSELAEAATAPDAPLVAGEWCVFCRARGECPALRQRALMLAGLEFDVVKDEPALPDPHRLTPGQLARVLTAGDTIDLWLQSIRAHAKQLADAGQGIPGFKLVNRRGRRFWVDEARAAKALRALPFEELWKTTLNSPAQIEKSLRREKLPKPDAWDRLIDLTDPGTALVPTNDPRPAVAPRLTEFTADTEEQIA